MAERKDGGSKRDSAARTAAGKRTGRKTSARMKPAVVAAETIERPRGAAPAGKTARKTARKSTRKTARKGSSPRGVRGNGGDADIGGVGKTLVIVESPAKARTIAKYLGGDFRVKATVGHIIDLPAKKLGIDVERGYRPEYVAIPGKEKTIAELKTAAKSSSVIYLATDPDREGEAIAWHVAGQVRGRGADRKTIRRVLFHEITRDAVRRAMESAGEIDERKVDAQQARRVLDRLVGYKASPLLWKTVKKGLSAGRVQTVALRLIVERENEVRAFTPVEYWTIAAALTKGKQEFTARLHQLDGKKPEIGNEETARGILEDLEGVNRFTASEVKRRERRKNPAPPFTTSTLQQEGAKKLGFGSKRTMRVAQSLYEGVELGKDGSVGLISYMRTDSTRVAQSAALAAREHLSRAHGEEYLARTPQLYGSGGAAARQDAHECVRPTDPSLRPDDIKRYLNPDQFKLYQLIWQRFMASQMAPAVFDTTTLDFEVRGLRERREYMFRATGSVIKFQGFLTLYREAREDTEGRALEDEQALPAVERGEAVPVREIVPTQHFTEPPPRFSEASLVKELERLGIGRPSTYAQIISVLTDRHYVELEQRRFTPTELGETVAKVMIKQFPAIFDVAFTSTMEGELDKIEEGELTWKRVLDDFYQPFDAALRDVRVEELIATAHDLSKFDKERCPDCGGRLEPRGGFFGPFLACERHPKACKHTRPLRGERHKPIPTDEICHLCGAPMVIRKGRSGQFLGCSTFPKCRGTRSVPTGIKCPKCSGDIIERQARKRRQTFYACATESCDFVIWNKPVAESCPECGYVGAEAKSTKARGEHRRCIKCANEWDVETPAETEALAG